MELSRTLAVVLLAAIGVVAHSVMPIAGASGAPQTGNHTPRRARETRRAVPPTPPVDTIEKLAGKTEKIGDAVGIAVTKVDAASLAKLLPRAGQTAADARPLLINFWATWCEPCRAEFPDLVKLDNEFRPRGLEFLTISLDDKAEIATTVPAFLREMKAARIPAYLLDTPEPADAINAVDPAWSGALPATFLFDRQGTLVYKHTGRIVAAELRAAIRTALRVDGK